MTELPSRLADIEAISRGVRRRWGIVCIGTVALTLGRSLGLSELTPWLLGGLVAVGGIANLAMVRLLRLDWYRWWLVYACCLLDVLLVALAIVYLGPGGTITGFFVVVIPCAFRPNRALGLFALSTASLAFLIAAVLHSLLSNGPDRAVFVLQTSVYLELVLFVAVAMFLLAALSEMFGRVVVVQSVIEQATEESIELLARAPRNDLIGQLEQSLNRMLEQLASTIEVVQHEADEVDSVARLFAQSVSTVLDSNRHAALMAAELIQGLGDLQSIAEAGHTESTEGAREAQNLQSRAEGDVATTLEFEETAQLGRDRVVRTSESVLAIGTDISRATSIVNELGGLSRQIGSSALSIAKVARHTHVLALNAAIEAARAEEHGKEFAVVADQVRTLAGEAGRSARDVGDLVSEVQAGIVAAANALVAGEEKVNDIGLIVSEARSALNELRAGASNAADLAATTVEFSQSQATRAGSLAGKMSQLATTSTRWSSEVNEAVGAMSAQIAAMGDLNQANQRLASLAVRLRENVVRFSIQQTERSTPPKEVD
jgi:methyl-accepting chemotaxis protein